MKAIDMLDSKITVKGHIRNVTWKAPGFQSGDYAIFRFNCTEIEGDVPDEISEKFFGDEKIITFTGPAPSLSLSAEYTIIGTLTKHERYGYQYSIGLMTEAMQLNNEEDVRKFLEYILPENTVDRIFETFEDPIDILDRGDVISLTRVYGVGVARASQIIERYKENKINGRAFVELYDLGLTRAAVTKLCEIYGSPEALIKVIKSDPYMLIYEVKGIGWKKADEVAKNTGITGNDPRRVKAYMYYILIKDSEETGNTYMLVDELVDALLEEIPDTEPNKIREFLLDMIKQGKLFCESSTRRICLMENRKTEEAIAWELQRLMKAPVTPINNVDYIISKCESEVGYSFSAEQRVAINNCLTSNVSVLTALAGSGKTASMFPVAQAMRLNYKSVALCALSGKASLNLEEATGVPGSTIHRLLGYDPETGRFIHDRTDPLMYDMVILDEASMVDEYIFLCLLRAIPNGCKLVLVGDTGQLEPIGLGCVFHDIINSQRFPHVHLTKIFRQAQKSGVITESRRVYDGVPIVKQREYKTEVRGELQDFKIITLNEGNKIVYNAIAEYKRFMKEYGAKPDEIVIVVGKRVIGDTSARVFNEYIQKIVNPKPTPSDITINKKDGNTKYSITFRPGDRIRVTRNCYRTLDEEGKINPVFNGNIGRIIHLTPEGMLAEFSQGRIYIPRINFIDLELGYAITCHSAQGSGFPYVITICDNSSYVLLSKEWLYTAITRSKKFNTLIGQPGAINRACSINGMKYKRTWLEDLIKDSVPERT